MPTRLAYLVTHPIQYQAPLLRKLAAEPDIDLTVFFGTDFTARTFTAEEFGQTGALPVVLAAWVPAVSDMMLSIALLLHTEDC